MPRSLLTGLAALAGLLAPTPALAAGHVAFLNFSDGRQAIHHSAVDDARTNGSQLCATTAVPAWDGGGACGPGSACRQRLVGKVQGMWDPFDITFTTQRPPAGDYAMVVVGAPSGSCQFGVVGLAPLDCGDQVSNNVGFVFACHPAELDACAVAISHELGHGFGLDHSDLPCDVMSSNTAGCAAVSFVDAPAEVPGCGRTQQNSHRLLLERLGPRPPAAGCAVNSRGARPLPMVLVVVAALGIAAPRRRATKSAAPSPRVEEEAHEPSDTHRDQLAGGGGRPVTRRL